MSWQGAIRSLLEDECAAVFGSEWSILPDGQQTPIVLEKAVLDDFVASSREESDDTVASIEAAKILEVRKSQGIDRADLPGGSSNVFGTATRTDDGKVFAIVAVRHDVNNLFLYLAGPE